MNEPAAVVSIVDDDASFLAATTRLLRAAGYEVRSYCSAEVYLAQLTDTPGCVIVDLHMPGLSGLELQAALASNPCSPPVIFLTGAGDIATSVRAMRHGAEDFLTKDAPKEALLQAVQRALQRDASLRAQQQRQEALFRRFDALTPREHEVLQQVVQGRLNKQIADALGIHERTVKLHRTAITTKLGVHSVAELTLLAREAGLIMGQSGPDQSGDFDTFPNGQ